MKRRKKFVTFLTSLITLFSFVITDVSLASQGIAPIALKTLSEVKVSTPFALNLPAELGTIQSLYAGNGPTLVHIQTAHGNYSAQKKIQAILHYLKDHYGFKTLFLEGSASELDPELLNLFPGQKDLTLQAADELTKEALVKGDELFLLEASEVNAFGIENIPTYRKTREAFKAVIQEQEKTRQFVQDLNLQIERFSSHYLNKDLKTFLRREEDYAVNRVSLEDWLGFLSSQAKKQLPLDLSDPWNQLEWPMLVRLVTLQRIESKIHREDLPHEHQAFREVLRRLPQEIGGKIDDLLASSLQENQSSALAWNHPGINELFEAMIAHLPENFSYDVYPNLKLWMGYLMLQGEIKSDLLMHEMKRLSGEIENALAVTEEERKVLSLLHNYQLLKQLFRLELTPDQYDEILKRNSSSKMKPSKLILEFLKFNEDNRVRDLEFSHLEEIDLLFEKALAFYQGVKERDGQMLQNMMAQTKKIGVDKAIVITGGFHAAPFEQFFETQGFHYALIAPNIENVEGREAYLQAVLQKDGPLIHATMDLPRRMEPLEIQTLMGEDAVWINARVSDVRQRTLTGRGVQPVLALSEVRADAKKGKEITDAQAMAYAKNFLKDGLVVLFDRAPKNENAMLTGFESLKLGQKHILALKGSQDFISQMQERQKTSRGRVRLVLVNGGSPKNKTATIKGSSVDHESDPYYEDNSVWLNIGQGVPAELEEDEWDEKIMGALIAWAKAAIEKEMKKSVPSRQYMSRLNRIRRLLAALKLLSNSEKPISRDDLARQVREKTRENKVADLSLWNDFDVLVGLGLISRSYYEGEPISYHIAAKKEVTRTQQHSQFTLLPEGDQLLAKSIDDQIQEIMRLQDEVKTAKKLKDARSEMRNEKDTEAEWQTVLDYLSNGVLVVLDGRDASHSRIEQAIKTLKLPSDIEVFVGHAKKNDSNSFKSVFRKRERKARIIFAIGSINRADVFDRDHKELHSDYAEENFLWIDAKEFSSLKNLIESDDPDERKEWLENFKSKLIKKVLERQAGPETSKPKSVARISRIDPKVSSLMMRFLLHLWRSGTVSRQDMAVRLGLTTDSIQTIVDPLLDLGWVKKEYFNQPIQYDPNGGVPGLVFRRANQRFTNYELTEQGKEFIGAFKDQKTGEINEEALISKIHETRVTVGNKSRSQKSSRSEVRAGEISEVEWNAFLKYLGDGLLVVVDNQKGHHTVVEEALDELRLSEYARVVTNEEFKTLAKSAEAQKKAKVIAVSGNAPGQNTVVGSVDSITYQFVEREPVAFWVNVSLSPMDQNDAEEWGEALKLQLISEFRKRKTVSSKKQNTIRPKTLEKYEKWSGFLRRLNESPDKTLERQQILNLDKDDPEKGKVVQKPPTNLTNYANDLSSLGLIEVQRRLKEVSISQTERNQNFVVPVAGRTITVYQITSEGQALLSRFQDDIEGLIQELFRLEQNQKKPTQPSKQRSEVRSDAESGVGNEPAAHTFVLERGRDLEAQLESLFEQPASLPGGPFALRVVAWTKSAREALTGLEFSAVNLGQDWREKLFEQIIQGNVEKIVVEEAGKILAIYFKEPWRGHLKLSLGFFGKQPSFTAMPRGFQSFVNSSLEKWEHDSSDRQAFRSALSQLDVAEYGIPNAEITQTLSDLFGWPHGHIIDETTYAEQVQTREAEALERSAPTDAAPQGTTPAAQKQTPEAQPETASPVITAQPITALSPVMESPTSPDYSEIQRELEEGARNAFHPKNLQGTSFVSQLVVDKRSSKVRPIYIVPPDADFPSETHFYLAPNVSGRYLLVALPRPDEIKIPFSTVRARSYRFSISEGPQTKYSLGNSNREFSKIIEVMRSVDELLERNELSPTELKKKLKELGEILIQVLQGGVRSPHNLTERIRKFEAEHHSPQEFEKVSQRVAKIEAKRSHVEHIFDQLRDLTKDANSGDRSIDDLVTALKQEIPSELFAAFLVNFKKAPNLSELMKFYYRQLRLELQVALQNSTPQKEYYDISRHFWVAETQNFLGSLGERISKGEQVIALLNDFARIGRRIQFLETEAERSEQVRSIAEPSTDAEQNVSRRLSVKAGVLIIEPTKAPYIIELPSEELMEEMAPSYFTSNYLENVPDDAQVILLYHSYTGNPNVEVIQAFLAQRDFLRLQLKRSKKILLGSVNEKGALRIYRPRDTEQAVLKSIGLVSDFDRFRREVKAHLFDELDVARRKEDLDLRIAAQLPIHKRNVNKWVDVFGEIILKDYPGELANQIMSAIKIYFADAIREFEALKLYDPGSPQMAQIRINRAISATSNATKRTSADQSLKREFNRQVEELNNDLEKMETGFVQILEAAKILVSELILADDLSEMFEPIEIDGLTDPTPALRPSEIKITVPVENNTAETKHGKNEDEKQQKKIEEIVRRFKQNGFIQTASEEAGQEEREAAAKEEAGLRAFIDTVIVEITEDKNGKGQLNFLTVQKRWKAKKKAEEPTAELVQTVESFGGEEPQTTGDSSSAVPVATAPADEVTGGAVERGGEEVVSAGREPEKPVTVKPSRDEKLQAVRAEFVGRAVEQASAILQARYGRADLEALRSLAEDWATPKRVSKYQGRRKANGSEPIDDIHSLVSNYERNQSQNDNRFSLKVEIRGFKDRFDKFDIQSQAFEFGQLLLEATQFLTTHQTNLDPADISDLQEEINRRTHSWWSPFSGTVNQYASHLNQTRRLDDRFEVYLKLLDFVMDSSEVPDQEKPTFQTKKENLVQLKEAAKVLKSLHEFGDPRSLVEVQDGLALIEKAQGIADGFPNISGWVTQINAAIKTAVSIIISYLTEDKSVNDEEARLAVLRNAHTRLGKLFPDDVALFRPIGEAIEKVQVAIADKQRRAEAVAAEAARLEAEKKRLAEEQAAETARLEAERIAEEKVRLAEEQARLERERVAAEVAKSRSLHSLLDEPVLTAEIATQLLEFPGSDKLMKASTLIPKFLEDVRDGESFKKSQKLLSFLEKNRGKVAGDENRLYQALIRWIPKYSAREARSEVRERKVVDSLRPQETLTPKVISLVRLRQNLVPLGWLSLGGSFLKSVFLAIGLAIPLAEAQMVNPAVPAFAINRETENLGGELRSVLTSSEQSARQIFDHRNVPSDPADLDLIVLYALAHPQNFEYTLFLQGSASSQNAQEFVANLREHVMASFGHYPTNFHMISVNSAQEVVSLTHERLKRNVPAAFISQDSAIVQRVAHRGLLEVLSKNTPESDALGLFLAEQLTDLPPEYFASPRTAQDFNALTSQFASLLAEVEAYQRIRAAA